MYSTEVTKHLSEGAKYYAGKDYEQAAAQYADACAAFNEANGAEDANLLFLYGRALFQLAVANSGVLGGVGADEKPQEKETEEEEFDEGLAEKVEVEEEGEEEEEEEAEGKEEDGAKEEEGEEQTDFEAAWEILDLARTLFTEQVDELELESASLSEPYLKSDDEEPAQPYVAAVQKLSETHDLLGEILLELDEFGDAAREMEQCLALRQKLYDAKASSLVAESHFKLSLALEQCVDDPALRTKAGREIEKAIAIVKYKQQHTTPEKAASTAELLRDLEERYEELKQEPKPDLAAEQLLGGLLHAVQSAGGAHDLTAAVKKTLPVNDLTAAVRKKAPANDLTLLVKKRLPGDGGRDAKRTRK